MIQLQDILFPTKKNRYQAFLVSPLWLISATLVCLCLISLGIGGAAYPQVMGETTNFTIENLITLTNQARQDAHVPPLRLNPQLTIAAYTKGEHMLKTNNFSHYYTQDQQPVDPWQFILMADYQYLHAGENLARDFSSSEELIAAWLESPAHQANLLNPDYQDIGIAIVEGSFIDTGPTILVVQLLATPLPPEYVGLADYSSSYQSSTLLTSASKPSITTLLDSSVILLLMATLISIVILLTFLIDHKQGSYLRRTHLPKKLWHT